MPIDVFISYRGADRVLARKLEQRLRSRWGSRVYRDETSLVTGCSWSDQLKDAMVRAKVMLALIGPGWHIRENGQDWVRDELLGAVEAGNPVLPVLVDDPTGANTRLSTLPEAFGRQAVKVSADLAGFDLHEIERALRALGAFGDRPVGGLGRELSEILPEGSDELIERLLEGRSIAVSGASGSGRPAMLRRIAGAATRQADLVAAHGLDLRARSRRTHSVLASWIDDLGKAIQGLAHEDRSVRGLQLVKAVIKLGPDLLARQVIRPGLLLPLGDDDSNRKILEAVRRPSAPWAPFPPERLVSQSLSVIREFVERSGLSLTLIVDNVESIDGSSNDLIRRLLERQLENVRLVLATSAVRTGIEPEPACRSIARALGPGIDSPNGFRSISLQHADTWGEPGEAIRRWLERHRVRLDDDIGARFGDFNPYYVLSALWYLVDNGHLVEDKVPEASTEDPDGSAEALDPGHIVTWVAATPGEELVVPSRERLLDHMIEEFVPARFRSLIEAGSLIGRRFAFSAAFAVTHPPESIDGQAPGEAALKRWRTAADVNWKDVQQIDPDGSVIVCHRSVDGERMISYAQADLVSHLTNALSDANARQLHERLAGYFSRPVGDDLGLSLDDQYRNARAAASHWASAFSLRAAADAERKAAELAERALAYPEARRHYRRAIRLLTQLLARTERCSTVRLVDHEDLLILADCLYRLGQMTRLAQDRGSNEIGAVGPADYFCEALEHLRELSASLHDKRLEAPAPDAHTATARRDLPEPNRIRHHIRLCETLSGWANVELAEWHGDGKLKDPRQLLFDALRHAEAAGGEADSRWLLAAASARLAKLLVDDAAQADCCGDHKRSHNLAIEAQFHIERVIGLAAVSPDEDGNLAEPRARAWMVLGQLFRTIRIEPRLAWWAFERMNEHRRDVSDLVDMMTDRELGLFLLSRHRGTADPSTVGARELLARHTTWAVESGIARERSEAQLNMVLLELVERSRERRPSLREACKNIDWVAVRAPDPWTRRTAWLIRGALHAIEQGDESGVAHDSELVVSAFRKAGIDGLTQHSTGGEVLREGWRMLLLYLLQRCPHLKDRFGLDQSLDRSLDREDFGTARNRFFSSLALDREVRMSLTRAGNYLDSAADGPLVPSTDAAIWRLLENRVPQECYEHARRTRAAAWSLLKRHRGSPVRKEAELTLLRRDIDYAVVVHEWYRSTDPSRLLTLARESNLRIDGNEWASPKVLAGRLAIQVLDRQYGAAAEIGRERMGRIESMVGNWTTGAKQASTFEQIFYIALQLQEPAHVVDGGGWRGLAQRSGHLQAAYEGAVEERAALVRQAGLPLVQDLHLVDAAAPRAATGRKVSAAGAEREGSRQAV